MGRAICVSLLVACLYGEWQAITYDQLQRDHERAYSECVSNEHYDEVTGKLTKSIEAATKSFDKAKEAAGNAQNAAVLARDAADTSNETVKLMTGGNSFPFVYFKDPKMEWGYAKTIGKYPVYNIAATFFYSDCSHEEGIGGCKGTREIGKAYISELDTGLLPQNADAYRFPMSDVVYPDEEGLLRNSSETMIALTARNGQWWEYYWSRAKYDEAKYLIGYNKAIRIYEVLQDKSGGFKRINLIWECRDSGFSNRDLAFDIVNTGKVFWGGKPIHIKSPEEGGIPASGLPAFPVVACPISF